MSATPKLVATADDRTGALEVGGMFAAISNRIPVGPLPVDAPLSVVDIDTRHRTPESAYRRMRQAHEKPAIDRCHKMDSGLRGNWPHEIRALVSMGYKVAVVASFPDAGRRCRDGVVYINDVPVLESPFGADPFSVACSSKPAEVLAEAGCLSEHVVVWDADDNAELDAALRRCRAERRILVGPTGAVGRYAHSLLPQRTATTFQLKKPVLVVCGSLNETSRNQLSQLPFPQYDVGEQVRGWDKVCVLKTPDTKGALSTTSAERMASRLVAQTRSLLTEFATLIVIGGDTIAALVEDSTLYALGEVAPGIPVSFWNERLVISKGGGIGTALTLASILNEIN